MKNVFFFIVALIASLNVAAYESPRCKEAGIKEIGECRAYLKERLAEAKAAAREAREAKQLQKLDAAMDQAEGVTRTGRKPSM